MLQFAIPCLLGLESLVGDEVKKLGLADVRVENGRVLCRGEERDLARLNINLRCGARVLLVLASFRATDFETLFQGTRAVRWEDWIPREGEFPVTGYSINSTLHSVPACQSIVKKAVVERLGAAYGLEKLPETGKRYQIRFSIMKDEVMLCLDASGEGLYKRGYRAVGVAAPLKETLAAAMVKLSHYNGRDPFCDPFCGSGTIAIEAALIAKTAPRGSTAALPRSTGRWWTKGYGSMRRTRRWTMNFTTRPTRSGAATSTLTPLRSRGTTRSLLRWTIRCALRWTMRRASTGAGSMGAL